jgi:hypothetical protein
MRMLVRVFGVLVRLLTVFLSGRGVLLALIMFPVIMMVGRLEMMMSCSLMMGGCIVMMLT